LVLFISTGCARTVYRFSSDKAEEAHVKNDSAFKKDVYECEKAIDPAAADALMGTSGAAYFEISMNHCLHNRGWRETPDGEYAYSFNQLKKKAIIE
jgi:hypothetical protein